MTTGSSTTETSVADDQLATFIDRILRMKEEADAIAADIREIYAEAKANGFDKTQLGNVVTYLRKKDKDAAKLEEGEAVFDLYLGSYLATKNRAPRVRAYARASNGPEITEPQEAQAPAQASDAQAADLPASSVVAISLPGAEGAADRDTNSGDVAQWIEQGNSTPQVEGSTPSVIATQSQPAPQAESDLTDPEPSGQVATIQPETATNFPQPDRGAAGEVDLREPAATTQGQIIREGDAPRETDRQEGNDDCQNDGDASRPDAEFAGSSNGRTAAFDAADAGSTPAPASSYVPDVVMEMAPFRPATRPHYHDAFPEILGKDFAALVDSIREEGVREPIIRMGDVILDGWARYNAARTLGIAYPVQDYSGSDPLLDVVRMQCRSRQFSAAQERVVAGKLAKAVPHRADEIMEAFGLAEELAEAE